MIIMTIITYHKICLRGTFLAPNTPTSLQLLLVDTNLAERQFLHKEQSLNKEKPLIYGAGTERTTISKRERQNLEQSYT
jgi:hypothetical protein